MPRGTRKYIVDLQQIREALVQSGYTKLDQQAKALGVHRKIKTRHKLGRLSAKTTQRILANPDTAVRHPLDATYPPKRTFAARNEAVSDVSEAKFTRPAF